MAPFDIWRESQKRRIERRAFSLFADNGYYGPRDVSDSLGIFASFFRRFRSEEYYCGGHEVYNSSEAIKAIEEVEKIKKRNIKISSYFWRNCSEFHGQRDFNTRFDRMLYLVGAQGLPDILAKDLDVESIISYPKTLFDHFYKNPRILIEPRCYAGGYGRSSYSEPVANIMVSFIESMIKNKHIPDVYDYDTAIDKLEIRAKLETIKDGLKIECFDFMPHAIMLCRLKVINEYDVSDLIVECKSEFLKQLPFDIQKTVFDGSEELSYQVLKDYHCFTKMAENLYYLALLERKPFSVANIEWFLKHNEKKLLALITSVVENVPSKAKSARK